MKKILYRCLALGMALLLTFQSFSLSALAQWGDTTVSSSESVYADESVYAPDIAYNAESTSASDSASASDSVSASDSTSASDSASASDSTSASDSASASDSTSAPESTEAPESSDVILDLQDEQAAQAVSYTLTLNLDGGMVNGMRGANWIQSSYQTYYWMRTLTAATSITLDDTLGGLLPEKPYRAGYTFMGWQVGETDASGTITIQEDTTVVAKWEVTTYNVSFQDNNGEIWSVNVPYGSTLWTELETPWTAPDVQWSGDTASVNITVGETEYKNVTVTRKQTTAGYYYTFTVAGTAYFTYGGPTPTQDGQHFVRWKLMYGGTGFTVTENAAFKAQFQVGVSYVFNVNYYYENGSKAANTHVVTQKEADVQDGKLTFYAPIEGIEHYTAEPMQQDGITWSVNGEKATVTVDIDTVFGADNTTATNFLALSVIYRPSTLECTIEYYQQKVGSTDEYDKVGSVKIPNVKYGNTVSIEDRPDLGAGVSFDGFQISVKSESALYNGVLVQKEMQDVEFDNNDNATIKIYYDRASYFIYFQTGTTEVQLDPIRIQYGAELPDMKKELNKLTRAGYTVDDITFYYLDENGDLVEAPQSNTMPAYDLYAVVTWRPDTTSIQLVYWIENKNSAGFEVADIVTVEQVQTEGELTVNLDNGVSIGGDAWPNAIDGITIVSENFKQLIKTRYGSEDYTTFFSYSSDHTKTSPGNVSNAEATNTGGVQDGAITLDEYTVKVNGDGTTSINIYFTRNLYTLEFVLAREDGGKLHVATQTTGAFNTAKWSYVGDGSALSFLDFENGVTATVGNSTYGDLNVNTTYQLTESIGKDAHAPIGRYGTKTVEGYNCYVYNLTARFEADISALWPTVKNIVAQDSKYNFISMGTNSNSYYHNLVAAANQKNILNIYSTMDRNVVAMGTSTDAWTVTEDPGTGVVAHQMVAFWSEGATEYHYYFLYEALDTTLTPSSPTVKAFVPKTANAGGYKEGDYVSYNGKVYVYSEAFDVQFSTAPKKNQNQPSRQGFISKGLTHEGDGNLREESNIYFFYDRETYTLDIQNVNVRYPIPEELLTTEFDSLSSYGEGIKTLQQLGWEAVNQDGTVAIRYGGMLTPMGNADVVDWLTRQNGGNLAYPIQSAGESQYYFWHWYNNATLDAPVDWDNDNEMRIVTSNKTLYVGWFTPRYTTTYVLNGGTWQDNITYAMTTTTTQDGATVYIYYPHDAQDETAPVYWYVQTKDEDELFVDTLYTCEVGKVAQKDASGTYWELNDDLTADKLLELSKKDDHGSRLVGNYYCYEAEGGIYNHEKYVHINSTVNSILQKPVDPVRDGYTFKGWYRFDDVPAQGTKTYLKDVLPISESVNSYGEGYVYVNHVGDVFLLHEDENGELFYYPEQTGYRYSYENNAAVVVKNQKIYAAWKPRYDAKAVVYHLVEKSEIEGVDNLTPKGESTITVDTSKTITIGGVEYCILSEEQLDSLYSGNTYPQAAWEYCREEIGRKWLPTESNIDLHADNRTQTITGNNLDAVTGNTYRVEAGGTYIYYAFFVYRPVGEIEYNIYTIDLDMAVASGALKSYQDTFDRTFEVDPSAPYFLGVQTKVYPLDNVETTVVAENAPSVSGYVVYQDLSQTLQLQMEGNNIFFYYVREDKPVNRYSITYYLKVDGVYSPENTITISNIPASLGEIVSLSDMIATYNRLIVLAQTYSEYANAENPVMQALYERYKDMTITLTRDGQQTSFTIDADVEDTLNLSDIEDLPLDYYLEAYSPSGENMVVSDGAKIEAYLAQARLVVQKVDPNQIPLAGAEFQLERLVEDADGDISYNGKTYSVDTTVTPVTATSGADGKAIFQNLSAKILGEGTGYLYRLTETQAPKGYNRLTSPMYVTTPYTVDGKVHYDVTYTVVNTGISYLPASGVFGGVYIPMFLGSGFIAVAIGGGIVLWRRKKTYL